MTNFARTPARVAALSRRSILLALSLLVAGALSASFVASAGAVVTTAESVHVGLQPRNGVSYINSGEVEVFPAPEGHQEAIALPGKGTFANAEGNAVIDGSSIYAVYWDPEDLFNTHNEWLVGIDRFLQHLGSSSGSLETIFSPLGQYRDRANAGALNKMVFKGSYHDFTKYPTTGNCNDPHALSVGSVTCLTDAQLRTQLESFISEHSLPTGMNTIYYLITPPGVTVCLGAASEHCSDFSATHGEVLAGARESESYENSFCSYHGAINPDNAVEGDSRTILYGAIPWAAGDLGSEAFLTERYYAEAFDCQDGGWNPTENKESREVPKEPTEAEEAAFEKATNEEKAAIAKARRLEGPHQEEPNQEGKGEYGDYSPGLYDLDVNQIAEEQADIVTDPMLNGWKDERGREVTDECRNVFASTVNHGVQGDVRANSDTEAGFINNTSIAGYFYYINNVYSIANNRCVGGTAMVPRFTAPDPVNTGEIVAFDGMESTVGLFEGRGFGPSGEQTPIYATYNWNFGDGTEETGFAPGSAPCEAPWQSPCAGSVFHTYAHGGEYAVTLTVTDIAGNVGRFMEKLTVDGPSAPEPAGSVPGSPGAPGSASTGSTGAPSTGGPAATPKPAVAAVVASKSLHTALRKGIVVKYSVNEKVTGRFEVLISRTLAKKLKISGTPATGLPAGTPPQLVIGRAVLVTTKGGHSSVAIKLSKKVSARLAHAHSAPLMLRMVVHNASSPVPVTVLNSVTLAG